MRDIAAELKGLRLYGMMGAWEDVSAGGHSTGIQTSRWLIEHLLQAEHTDRHMRSISYQMHAAKFPVHRDLAGFEFEQSKVASPRLRRPVSQAGKPFSDGRCGCRWHPHHPPWRARGRVVKCSARLRHKTAWGKCGTPSPTTNGCWGILKSTLPHGFLRCLLPGKAFALDALTKQSLPLVAHNTVPTIHFDVMPSYSRIHHQWVHITLAYMPFLTYSWRHE